MTYIQILEYAKEGAWAKLMKLYKDVNRSPQRDKECQRIQKQYEEIRSIIEEEKLPKLTKLF